MSVETEFKFTLPPRIVGRVMQHAAIERMATGPAATDRLLSVYYDTPDFSLRAAGIALRLRRTGAGWVQTVKWAGSALGGLHQRNELEVAVPDQTLALDALTAPEIVVAFASARLRRRIRPVFVTDFQRTTRVLAWPDGARAELSLDHGHVIAGHAQAPICELEVELKGGAVGTLFDLVAELEAGLVLRPEIRSKAERGYVLAGVEARPVRAQPVVLQRDWSIPEAAARIVGGGLAQLQANEHGVLHGSDPEYLHQMRVAVRRLRSCLGVHARVLPPQAIARLRADLAWLGRRLGPARDWDVFLTEMLPALEAGVPGSEDLRPLRAHAERLRETAQRGARAAVHTRRYARMVFALGRAAATGSWGAGEAIEPGPVLPFVAHLLERRLKRVLARGGKMKAGSIEELHALRIAVKKLRYAVEFYASLYVGSKPRAYRERLTKLQDSLGVINDAGAMQTFVARALAPRARLHGVVTGWSAHTVYAERARVRVLWREFRRLRKFW